MSLSTSSSPRPSPRAQSPETSLRLDGGRAWLDAALAALSMFTVFATAYSFGTFVKPMAAEFDADRGATALVFGLTALLYFGLGAVTGPLVQRVGPRRMIAVGGTIQVAGILLTTRVTELWQAYVTYGIGVGIGVACGYVPMVAVVGGWFDRKRPTAIGLAVSGIGLSSLIGAPVAARLISAYGWRTAYVVFGCATAALLAIVALFIRTPPSFGRAMPITLSSAIRTKQFALSYLGVLLISLPLFSVFVNLVPYAEDQGITKVTAATLISCIGAASIGGRTGLAWLANRIGVASVYGASIAAMACTQIIWLFAGSSFLVLVVFSLVFGFAYGGFISLGPALLAEIFGPEQLGGLAGVNYSAAGVGALFGPTVGAWLVDRSNGYAATIVAGLLCGLAGTIMVGMLVFSGRRGGWERTTGVE